MTKLVTNVPVEDLVRLAETHRILEIEGHGDMTQGHLSLRDPDGRGFWLKRHGLGIGEIMDETDFTLLDFDGRQVAGEDRGKHSEWPIHAEIFKRRPEINVVGHTHSFYTSVFSATNERLQPVTMDGARLPTETPHFKGSNELVHTPEIGADLAKTLGEAYAIIMGNHGSTFLGKNIEQAFVMGISLERACRAQLSVEASGLSWTAPNSDLTAKRRDSIAGHQDKGLMGFYRQTWDYYRRKLVWAESKNALGMKGYFSL
jgi:ribulose-5-phosphate 4-epimerase/fuculose-1-phosphate aldolase